MSVRDSPAQADTSPHKGIAMTHPITNRLAQAARQFLVDAKNVITAAPADDSDARTHHFSSGAQEVTVDMQPPKLPKGAVFVQLLEKAFKDFAHTQHQIYLQHIDGQKRYQLHRLRVLKSAENAPLLADFSRMLPSQQADIASKFAKALPMYDISAFQGVEVCTSPASSDSDEVVIFAGDGPLRTEVGFEFEGQFVDAPQAQAQATPAQARQSQIGTLWTPSVNAPKATVLTVSISQSGKPDRMQQFGSWPVRVGRSEDCDLIIDHEAVSRTHLVLLPDASGTQLTASDHSKAGTALSGANLASRALMPSQATDVPTDATLTLAPDHAQPVVLRVTHGLTAPLAPQAPAPSQPIAAPAPAPSPVQSRQAQPTLLTPQQARMGAAPTLLHVPDAPTARLRVRYSSGREDVHAVSDLPLVIGREPLGAHCHAIDEAAIKVSRSHIRLERSGTIGFEVHNLAHGANGTFAAGVAQPAQFHIEPTNQSQQQWFTMGAPTLGAQTVAFCVEVVT